MKRILFWVALIALMVLMALISSDAFAQTATRFDGVAQTTQSINGNTVMVPSPYASITVCASPATGGLPCTNKASVCPDSTGTSCTTGSPNNPITADAQGNFGFWALPGTYAYSICPVSGVCRGPYIASMSAGGGLAGGATLPLLYDTGTQTIAIQKSDLSHDGYLASADWTTFNAKLDGQVTGSTIRAFGDSITWGQAASDYAHSWAKLVATARGKILLNYAYPGDRIDSFANHIFGETDLAYIQPSPATWLLHDGAASSTVAANDTAMVMIGSNDAVDTLTNAWGEDPEWFARGLYGSVIWLAIPETKKLRSTSTSITKTGVWTTSVRYDGAILISSPTAGATATATLTGTTVYVCSWMGGGGGVVTISVDGKSFGSIDIGTNRLHGPAPYLIRIPGLQDGPHTVVMTQVSGTAYLMYMAGNGGAANSAGPNVYVLNTTPRTAYTPITAKYQTIERQMVSDLASDGLNVAYVDAAALFNPSTMTGDGIHPNDTGYALIANAVLEEMFTGNLPRDRGASVGAKNLPTQRLIYTNIASTTVANTVTETSVMGSFSGIPNIQAPLIQSWQMDMGKTYRVRVRGFLSDTGTPTLIVKFKAGTTVLATSPTVTLGSGVSNVGFEAEYTFTCRTQGTSGTVIGQGVLRTDTTVTPIVNTAAVTVDTTAQQVIDATVTWGTASASNTITVTNATLEVLN